jgi:hypothetical protein
MILKSKRILIGIAAATIVLAGYIFYALGNSAPPADDMKGWALAILIFIGISVVAQIVVQIMTHVAFAASVAAKEKDKNTIKRMIESEMAEDEMDERITLKASHIGYGCIGVGFVIILFLLVFAEISAALLLNLILMMFFSAVLIDGIVSIYLYERGDSGRICRRRDE